MSRSRLLPRAMSGSVLLQQLGSVLMTMAHDTTKGYACPWSVLLLRAMIVSVAYATAEGCVDVPRSVLPPVTGLWRQVHGT